MSARHWDHLQAPESGRRLDWTTPRPLFDKLNAEFHFTLDAAASSHNALCPNYYSDGALQRPWPGIVWCNPPYGSELGRWVGKARGESRAGSTVVLLIPARTDVRWWHEHIIEAVPPPEVRFLKGRLRFGLGRMPAPFASAIVIYRGDPKK